MENLTIGNLAEIVAALPAEEQQRFRRIFAVTSTTGELRIPKGMAPWVSQHFGSVAAVSQQKIVKVNNQVTGEGTLFNQLRSLRPIQSRREQCDVIEPVDNSINDLFQYPEANTPADVFGRVTGKYCITASNIAKYDGLHGLVIFKDFDRQHFSKEQIIDFIDTGWEWAQRAHSREPDAHYFLFIWNCLWRAGASIHHGHAQVMLTRHSHYAKIESLRRAARGYQRDYAADYFSDLYQAHRAVGCAAEKNGVKTLAMLTPFKDNEVMLIGDGLNLPLEERIYEVLTCFRDRLGVTTFNLGLVTPPLGETEESWQGFPVVAWMLDRGDLNSQASDVGGMELFAQSVVASDPFELARQLKICPV